VPFGTRELRELGVALDREDTSGDLREHRRA
jgi:hypothetical protein